MCAADSSLHLHGLIERMRQGDRAAFDDLVHRYRQRLMSIIRLRLGSSLRRRADVEDLLQEALLRAFRGLKGFEWEGRPQFVAWLTTITERTCTDFVRRNVEAEKNSVRREVSLGERVGSEGSGARLADILRGPSDEPHRAMRREERLSRLEDALDSLAPQHREVIILSILQRLPTREVARRLGLTSGAVCMLRTRALASLKDIFGNTESLRLPHRPIVPEAEDTLDPSPDSP